MIDALSITDVNGVQFDFSVGESPPTELYPVDHWEVAIGTRVTLNPKMQAHGAFPAPTYMESAVITIEGSIFGTDYSTYNANYVALKAAVHPLPNIAPALNTKVGTLKVTPTGLNLLETDVTLTGWTAPQDGNSFSKFQIIWTSFDPWFIDSVTTNPVIL